MIKLLALDLDGTLLNSRGEIPDKNREAIRAAEHAGVLVTIATGRRFRDARPVGLDLGLNAPLITHNGARLKYADTLRTVHADLITLGRATASILRPALLGSTIGTVLHEARCPILVMTESPGATAG